MRTLQILAIGCLLLATAACQKFLNIVPDNVATLENAFSTHQTAEKYLFTCYAYMPSQGDMDRNPALAGEGEIIFPYPAIGFSNTTYEQIARGNQNVVNPALNYWDGDGLVRSLFQGIRDCNIFLENIGQVHDVDDFERKRWIAEVQFLKAYYNFWLLRMYGPIPLVDKNLPISATVDEVKVHRLPIDSCITYIVQLLDSAAAGLPDRVVNPNSELGRMTRPIALATKAMVLVTAASPLFNGNTDYPDFNDANGTPFFNPTKDMQKWEKAAEACKAAIDLCHSLGKKLYYFSPSLTNPVASATPRTFTKLSIRNAVTEQWNSEIIWGNPNCNTDYIQNMALPPSVGQIMLGYSNSVASVPLNIVTLFYSKNGVPIDEDKTWNYERRYRLQQVPDSDRYDLQPGYTTAALNMDREARFYADLGFDGSSWFGQGRTDDNSPWYIEAKAGQAQGITGSGYSITGYWPKKLVNFTSDGRANTYYSWPVIRLSELYLMYAEALNEVGGPSPEVFPWIDSVRARAGLPTVAESWTQFSTNPDAYTTQAGLRDIIHHETLVEMAFEGKRFWNLRRWKEAPDVQNNYIQGWNVREEETAGYYQPQSVFSQNFGLKDYFWPIKQEDLNVNTFLVQNPGW